MNRETTRKAPPAKKRLTTTLGDIISAAYEAVPGIGDKKLEHYGDELLALVRAADA